ncbi:hypothetical protein GDO86_000771 [Hymenochirus boettgeri]|uniref:Uncharacterized protein n=1 Tax=Hymenochirus boettgeri TaxID=247094 RepID=A0A8T2KEE7_9PIPI|nr:hypothetical protein GDO86_000771 [Hymenochirus boettgeri]
MKSAKNIKATRWGTSLLGGNLLSLDWKSYLKNVFMASITVGKTHRIGLLGPQSGVRLLSRYMHRMHKITLYVNHIF